MVKNLHIQMDDKIYMTLLKAKRAKGINITWLQWLIQAAGAQNEK